MQQRQRQRQKQEQQTEQLNAILADLLTALVKVRSPIHAELEANADKIDHEFNALINKIIYYNLLQKYKNNKVNLVAAMLLIIAKKLNLSISYHDILHCKEFIKQKHVLFSLSIVNAAYRTLIRTLNIELPSIDYRNRVQRIVSTLKTKFNLDSQQSALLEEAAEQAIKYLEDMTKTTKLDSRNPDVVAAAALYHFITKLQLSQQQQQQQQQQQYKDKLILQYQIAEAALITTVGLRKAYKKLFNTTQE